MGRALVLIAGFVAFVAATLSVWLLAEPSLGGGGAWAAALGESLGVPVLLTFGLLRSLRRQDPTTRFGSTMLGMTGGCAVVTLIVLGLFARAPLSRALVAAPGRHALSGWIGAGVGGLGRWIAPSRASRSERAQAGRDAGPSDAGAKAAPPARHVARADAGRPARPATEGDAGASPPPAPVPSEPAPPETTRAELRACEDPIRAILTAELGPQGVGDEIAVVCADSVRVLWRLADGRVLERTRIDQHAPEGLELVSASPRLLDVDEDGAPDLLLGAIYTSERGGTRGGDTWWAPGQPDGQFGRPVRLAGGFCAGLDAGDVDGDGQAELVILHEGNPWNPAQPNGELRWYERQGRRFTLAGHQPAHRQPSALWLTDVDRDGKMDAVAQHDWEEDDVVVFPGTERGLGPIVEDAEAPSPPSLQTVELRLDDDGRPDRAWADRETLYLEATSRLSISSPTVERSLDHQAYDVGN